MKQLLDNQRKRYDDNWKKSAPFFGSVYMPPDPSPLYWIGIGLDENLFPSIKSLTEGLGAIDILRRHRWLLPEELHVTLALPGRPNNPYTDKDLPKIISTLQEIAKAQPSFVLNLGSMNCFPYVLFREVYSPDESLFALHSTIADKIPFSEEPQYRYENFMPHMSLCYLKEIDSNIAEHISVLRNVPQVPMKVTHLKFLSVSDIGDMKGQPLAIIEMGTGILV